MTLLVSASAFAFNVLEQPIYDDVVNAQELSPAQLKAKLAKKVTKKDVTIADLEGYYKWSYYTSKSRAEDPATITDRTEGEGMVKVYADGDSLIFKGFDVGASNLAPKAGLNAAEGYLSFPSQVAYTSSTYGPCHIVSLWYDASAGGFYFSREVGALINEDGSLEIPNYVYLRIESGNYAGYRIGDLYSFNTFTIDETINGEMEVSYLQGKFTGNWNDQVFPVRLTQTDNVVSVQNFLNDGLTVDIMLNNDRTISIEKQLTKAGGDTYGDFFIYPTDWSLTGTTVSSYITGETINGYGYDTELTWGNCVNYSTTNYWTGPIEACRIYRIDDGVFVYGTVGVNDVDAAKTVAGVTFYNLAGVASATPFDGVNIEVVKYTDGTTKAVKVVK